MPTEWVMLHHMLMLTIYDANYIRLGASLHLYDQFQLYQIYLSSNKRDRRLKPLIDFWPRWRHYNSSFRNFMLSPFSLNICYLNLIYLTYLTLGGGEAEVAEEIENLAHGEEAL